MITGLVTDVGILNRHRNNELLALTGNDKLSHSPDRLRHFRRQSVPNRASNACHPYLICATQLETRYFLEAVQLYIQEYKEVIWHAVMQSDWCDRISYVSQRWSVPVFGQAPHVGLHTDPYRHGAATAAGGGERNGN